jgi:hypothetical protein
MTKKVITRILNPNFFGDLLSGQLGNLLLTIKGDNTLDLQIRHNQIHVYYRGGKILDIKPHGAQSYKFGFDENYFQKSNNHDRLLVKKLLKKDLPNFPAFFRVAKQGMDIYISSKKSEEREFQQLIVRTNNYSSIANATDYFIVDIEYAKQGSRFDLIAIEWKSETAIRRLQKGYKPRLMIIEMKYGEGALGGKAGLTKHHLDIESFIQDKFKSQNFIHEMEELFLQKLQLGLIPCLQRRKPWKDSIKFNDQIEFGYLIADHDPASKRLINELVKLPVGNMKFITSNFTGYALYNENVFDLVEFKDRFLKQIG